MEIQDLIKQREATKPSTAARREINKLLVSNAVTLKDKILVYTLIRKEEIFDESINLTNTIEEWIYFVEKIGYLKFDKNYKLLDKLLKIKSTPKEIHECLIKYNYLRNCEYVMDLCIRNNNTELFNIICQDILNSDDIRNLLSLSSRLANTQSIENKLLLLTKKNDFKDNELIFSFSKLGSKLEAKIINRIVNDYSFYQLIYILKMINSKLYDLETPIDDNLLDKFVGDEYSEYVNDYFSADQSDASQTTKIVLFRREIIISLASKYKNNAELLLLLTSLVFESDIDIFNKSNSNVVFNEWAELEFRDNNILWHNSYLESDASGLDSSIKGVTYKSSGRQLIETYFEKGNRNNVIRAFWLIKWKIVSNNFIAKKDIDLFDNRLFADKRFIHYYGKLLQIGAINIISMTEIFSWPLAETLQNFYNPSPNTTFTYLASESPLHELGYTVGITSNLNAEERNRILNRAFRDAESAFFEYGWGTPGSPKRLSSIAWHLARNIWRVRNRDEYEKAKEEWHADLETLKMEFYDDRMATEFIWPDSSAR
jgi:hypothetical protein